MFGTLFPESRRSWNRFFSSKKVVFVPHGAILAWNLLCGRCIRGLYSLRWRMFSCEQIYYCIFVNVSPSFFCTRCTGTLALIWAQITCLPNIGPWCWKYVCLLDEPKASASTNFVLSMLYLDLCIIIFEWDTKCLSTYLLISLVQVPIQKFDKNILVHIL